MNFCLHYVFILIIISSYILWFILPMGHGRGGNTQCDSPFIGMGDAGNYILIFGLSRYEWIDIHSWISIIMVIFVIIYVFLHWRWIVEIIKKVDKYIVKRQWAIIERYVVVFQLFILVLSKYYHVV